VQSAALASLQRFESPAIAETVIASLSGMTEPLRQEAFTLLATRTSWSLALAKAVEAGKVEAASIPAMTVQRIRRHHEPQLAALVLKIWGEARTVTSAQLQAEIVRVAGVVRSQPGDPRKGEPIFAQKCSACHTLFGKGGKVGPELTTYQRDNLDTMLLSLVNPGAEIREGYAGYLVATRDGRTLSGLLVDQDPSLVVLRGAEGRDISIPREEIEEMEVSRTSIMPEGLLTGMNDKEIRDLMAYLRGNQPPK
jgi:putative heme-binding domain-containing protein